MNMALEVAILVIAVSVIEAAAFTYDRLNNAVNAPTAPDRKKLIHSSWYFILRMAIQLVIVAVLACIWWHETR
jgi:hypothetical protein